MSRKHTRGKWGKRLPITQRMRDELALAIHDSRIPIPRVAEMISDHSGAHPTPSFLRGIIRGHYSRCGTVIQKGIEQFINTHLPSRVANARAREVRATAKGTAEPREVESLMDLADPEPKENDLLDRILVAVETLDAEQQHLITQLAEQLATTSEVLASANRFDQLIRIARRLDG